MSRERFRPRARSPRSEAGPIHATSDGARKLAPFAIALLLSISLVAGNATAAARLSSSAVTSLVETSPGDDVLVTYTVRNLGDVTETVTFTVGAPSSWTATLHAVGGNTSATTATLAPGASVLVDVNVTASGTPLASLVTLYSTGSSGATSKAEATVRTPISVDLVMDFTTYFLSTPVTGNVVMKFLDGTPASGHKVTVSESSAVGAVHVGLTRVYHLTAASDGTAPFSFPVDVTAANAPGDHRVIAKASQIVSATSTDAATYVVL